MEKLSFVIPCYGSESTIQLVVQEVQEVMQTREGYTYEIILVNDFSPDRVYNVIKKLAKNDPEHIKGITFARNFGQHAALMAGYRFCTGDIVISLDDDGQTPINSVFTLIDKLNEGYDVVYASYSKIRQSAFRILGSKVNKRMMEIMIHKPKDIDANSFYVARKFVIDEIILYHNSYPYLGGLIFRTTQNIASVTVDQRNRIDGKSGYSIKKLVGLWINGFTAFSTKPLQVASVIGIIVAAIGFCIGLYTIIHKLLNPLVPAGYSSLMAVILFLGGMIMIILGLIGEYVGRIYISINAAPQYVIRETLNLEKEGKSEL